MNVIPERVYKLYEWKTASINEKVDMTAFFGNFDPLEINQFYLEEAEIKITNYINWSYVPESLYFVWASLGRDLLLADLYRSGLLGKGESEGTNEPDIDPNSIKKIIVGDTTTEFGTSHAKSAFSGVYTPMADTNREIDAIVRGYKFDLDRHRKIVHFI